MANIIRLGSLYLDGRPANAETEYKPSQAISIGETIPGKEISWVVVNNMLVADRCILFGVSWDDLNANGLVFGKEVSIGGFRYTVRLLKVGAKQGAPNEWDSALDAIGVDNDVWHWEGAYFWGQEAAKEASIRAYRGHRSARYYHCYSSSLQYVNVGFRPALIPLPSGALWPSSKAMWWLSEKIMWDDARLDEKLWLSKKKAMWMLWGGQNIIFGRLEELNDYEVVLSDWNGALSNMTFGEGYSDFGSQLDDGCIVVERSAIAGVQTKQKEAT